MFAGVNLYVKLKLMLMKKNYVMFICFLYSLVVHGWDGQGTMEAPYLISSAKDILMLGEYYGAGDKDPAWFRVTQDIDMQGVAVSPVGGSFNGYIDGQHHAIKNLVIEVENGGAALFSRVTNGGIKDLTIASGYIKGNSTVAAFALTANESWFSGCTNHATIIAEGRYAGPVGGLVATCTASVIRNCVNKGIVLAEGENSGIVGGIVGSTNGMETIDSCANYGVVKGVATVGGIVGSLSSNDEAYRSYNMGYVSGKSNVGGIAGSQGLPLISENDSSYIYMSWNGGEIVGEECVGGIGGDVKTIYYSCNVGQVGDVTNAIGTYVGGLCGSGNVSYSYNLGQVNGNTGIGGIAGTVSSIETCFNRGDISGKQGVGGLGGLMEGTSCEINACYNSSKIHCESVDSFGAVTGYIYYGGFINSNEVKETYWNTDLELTGYSGTIGSDIQMTGLSGTDLAKQPIAGFVSDISGANGGFPLIENFEFTDQPQMAETSIVTVTGSENGLIYPANNEWRSSVGSCLSFKLLPDEGYYLSDIIVDGISVMAASEEELSDTSDVIIYSFQPTLSNHSIVFNFSQLSDISTVKDKQTDIWLEQGVVCINSEPGLPYSFYTVDGRIICQGKTSGGVQKITVQQKLPLLLVKVGGYISKLAE